MKYFNITELTRTSTGLPNKPTQEIIDNLTAVVEHILDPLRQDLGLAIRVTSGYRSPEVNRKVGGSPTSQHCKGEAVDFVCNNKARAFEILRNGGYPFDQLIWEFGDSKEPSWIHVSYRKDGKNRGQVLRAVKNTRGKTEYLRLNGW